MLRHTLDLHDSSKVDIEIAVHELEAEVEMHHTFPRYNLQNYLLPI